MVRSRLRRDWRALVARFEAEGGTQGAFAERVGVNVWTFREWLKQVRRERSGDTGPGDMALVPFVEVDVPEALRAGGSIEVAIGRVVVRLPELPPPAWLAEFARAC